MDVQVNSKVEGLEEETVLVCVSVVAMSVYFTVCAERNDLNS
jgi:hypothetical protein